jgi:uncharacterized membrane protein
VGRVEGQGRRAPRTTWVGAWTAPLTTRQTMPRLLLRWALAAFLATAGAGHFLRPEDFLQQVPPYLPQPELLVAVSGIAELALALALVVLPRHRRVVGLLVALLFLAVLPGNIAQYTEGRDAFGLDSDVARLTRLALHPLLWLWALAAGDVWPRQRPRRVPRHS